VEGGKLVQKPVQPGHANVVQAVDAAAGDLGGDCGLFRDGEICGAGAADGNAGQSGSADSLERDGTGGGVVNGVRNLILDRLVGIDVSAGD
jgi:hypothetical protein